MSDLCDHMVTKNQNNFIVRNNLYLKRGFDQVCAL